jgi:hydrogenase-1 operon protein HyaF
MSRLHDIPVRVEGLPQGNISMPSSMPSPPPTPAGLGGGIAAILSELATLLERLAARDETAMIDLGSLPMSAADRIELQRVLGDGEVHATLQAQGISTARETGVAGVWWIEHRDAHDGLMAELLEVARFPQILASAPDEIQSAAAILQARNSPSALTHPPGRSA